MKESTLNSIQGGVLCSPAPGTPTRRSCRTKSLTRSPSPFPVKKPPELPILETLQKVTNNSNNLEENKEEVILEAERAPKFQNCQALNGEDLVVAFEG
ncbi:uncharacterized protein ACN427_003167 isoform 1-T1 [Glossina fuscipes fuscipes]